MTGTEEQLEPVDRAEAERGALVDELRQIKNSQSQFELYTDREGEYRWRLRHRNGNVIADSGQGYSSRQRARQGLNAVKRDAFGGAVIDLDRVDGVEVRSVDDAVEGDDAPAFVATAESQAAFETYEDSAGTYHWQLRHDDGDILADSSEGYASRSDRNDALERIRYYAIAADFPRIDPAAFELYRDRGGEYRWRLLHQNGNILANSGEGYSSRQNARESIDSVQSNIGTDGAAEVEVYEDNTGAYRWRLVGDGTVIANSSEGYASKGNAEDAVEGILTYAPDAHVLDIGSAAFEIYQDIAGEWRWRLRHRNGNVMADSGEGYEDRIGAEEGVISVKQNAPNAALEDIGIVEDDPEDESS